MAGKNRVVDTDHGWRALFDRVDAIAGGAYVMVGLLGGDDAGGLHEPGAKLTTTEIGIVNEFGTADGRVPARPFLRPTFDRLRAEIEVMAGKLLLGVIDGKITVEKGLNVLGSWFSTQVKNYITQGPQIQPVNADSVLRRKRAAGAWNGSGKAQKAAPPGEPRTLVNTMTMVRSITWATFTSRAGRRSLNAPHP